MKKKKSVALHTGRPAGIIIVIVGTLGLLLTCLTTTSRSTIFFMLYIVICALGVCILSDCFSPAHITLTASEVHLYIRRTREIVTLPWADFSCLYELSGWQMKFYLLTPAPMDKSAQLTIYKACCKNKAIPYTHQGCLILNAYIHGGIIDQYMPDHIHKMPWQHCAKL